MLSCTTIWLVVSTVLAADPIGVPKEALAEMEYRVGKWESELYVDGVKQGQTLPETTTWTPGKYCIIMQTTVQEKDVTFPATGITGWNGQAKQLVEHWYGADGSYATFCYTLGKKKDSWVGTAKWVYADGKVEEGPSIVEKKSKDEWEWNASFESDGKTTTYRSINRRVD